MKNIVTRIAAFLLVTLLCVGMAGAQFAEQRVWGGTSGGALNAQTLTIGNFPAAPPVGVPFRWLAGFTNTTAATLNINGTGAVAVFKPTAGGAVALTGGEIVAGQLQETVFDGTRYQLTANNVQSAAIRTSPQGYLTPCNFANSPSVTGCTAGNPQPTGDVSAATTLYYGPWFGSQLPIYNGSNMVMTSFAELILTIPSSRLANTIYDVLIINDVGTVRACFGPAWSTSTLGSGARGTGAGTAEITQVQGVWVNTVSQSCVNGASTYSVAANQGTVVGTVIVDNTNGQVTFHVTAGQLRKWAAYNFYNQLDQTLLVVDATASWSYITSTWRNSRNDANNVARVLMGLPQTRVFVTFNQILQTTDSNTSSDPAIGIGWNVSNAPSGKVGWHYISITPTGGFTPKLDALASYDPPGFLGGINVFAIETGGLTLASNSGVFNGTTSYMTMKVKWRG